MTVAPLAPSGEFVPCVTRFEWRIDAHVSTHARGQAFPRAPASLCPSAS